MLFSFFNIRYLKAIIIYILFFIFSQTIIADEIYLENGDLIKGKIIQHKAASVKIKTKYMELIIEKKKIKRIKITRESKGNENLPKKLKGILISQTKKYLVIRTEKGKIIKILKNGAKPLFNPITSADIRWNSIWRSTLLPSWGQFYQKKYTKAWIVAGVSLASITGYLISYFNYRETLNKWNSGNHSQNIADELEKKEKPLKIFNVVTIVIWLLNIADAGIFSSDKLLTKKPSIAFSDSCMNNYFGINLKINF